MAPAPRRTGSSLDLCGLRQAGCGYRSARSGRRYEGSFGDSRLLDPLWRALAECSYAGPLGNGADATMRASAWPMKLAHDFGMIGLSRNSRPGGPLSRAARAG